MSNDSLKNIIFAEDDINWGMACARFIRGVFPDVNVLYVQDGEALVREVISSKNIGLVVTDNGMPKMSGLEAVKAIRQSGILVPVCMVSGDVGFDFEKKVYAAGIDCYIPKPVDVVALKAGMERLYLG